MAAFNSAVLTIKGNELLVDAAAGNKIIFTRMVVGGGEYTDTERERRALEKMTELKDARQEFPFSAHEKKSEQSVLLKAIISNKELTRGYKITEVGIYGKTEEDDEDFLCSVAVTKSWENSDTLPPYNGLQACEIVYEYYITISPDAEISVNTRGASVLVEEFDKFRGTILSREKELEENKLDKDGDGSQVTVEFVTAENRQNIISKESLSKNLGIIAKVFEEMGTAAFFNVVNNLLAEAPGVLDARQGKELKRQIDTQVEAMGGCRLEVREDGIYIIYHDGADAVSKKLGKPERKVIASSAGNGQYDVKIAYPDTYQSLQNSDFVYVVVKANSTSTHFSEVERLAYDPPAECRPALSYDPGTGIITLSGCTKTEETTYGTAYERRSVSVNGDIICMAY